jgi:hypothetical protein
MSDVNAKSVETELDIQALTKLQMEIIRGQNQVMDRARWTQNIILFMTIVAFTIGILLVIISIVQLLISGDLILGGFSAFGGVGTVLGTLLYNPMQRAQKSMGDLAQVQVALLSFNSKVTIWTVYVRNRTAPNSKSGILEAEKLKKITADIEDAASKALDQIEKYCEPKKTKDDAKKTP